jgi:hypothetical protein
VQQALHLQTEGQDIDQDTCFDEKHEVAGYQVLPTIVWAYTDWSVPEMVLPPRGFLTLVVGQPRQDGGLEVATHLPPVKPVYRPAVGTMEGGGNGNVLDSWQMQTHADL